MCREFNIKRLKKVFHRSWFLCMWSPGEIKLKSLHQLPLLSVSSFWPLCIFLDCKLLSPTLTAALFLGDCRVVGHTQKHVLALPVVSRNCLKLLRQIVEHDWGSLTYQRNGHELNLELIIAWNKIATTSRVAPVWNLNDGTVNCMGVNGLFTSKFSINLYMVSAHDRLLLGNHDSQRPKLLRCNNTYRLVDYWCGADFLITLNTSTFSNFTKTNDDYIYLPMLGEHLFIGNYFHMVCHKFGYLAQNSWCSKKMCTSPVKSETHQALA